jgi:hypothetical protein
MAVKFSKQWSGKQLAIAGKVYIGLDQWSINRVGWGLF